MASPFKKKSPLNAYKYSLTSEYAKPKRVIQPIVEADAAKAIGDASKKVLGVYSKIEADKLAKTASDEAGDLKHQRAMEVKWGKGNTGPAVKPASHEENMSNFGLTSFKDVQAERDAKDFMNRDFGGKKDPNSLVNIGRAGRKPKPKTPYIPPSKAGRGRGENVGYIPYHHAEKGSNGADRSMAMMKGSPNKLIGDTMDPYGQPQRGNRDFTFNEKGIAPGILGDQASMGVQNEIYGGGQAQVAAEQLASQAAISPRADEMDLIGNLDSSLAMKGTPLHTEGHGVEQAHKHPTKTTTKISGKGEMPGSSYVKDDYVDEDDLQDVGLQRHTATLVQSDNKGTFIKRKSDTGSESNISTAKGYGAKIRLNNMSRPDYTSNESSQSDPHNYLFQNTPKNNKKK